eukprot:GHVU01207523.1.p1 GENE.GHVU01207523.1~~GHVU01207523.1.p1  ORF type:complete len:346 (-),score=81.98 GHVU01207523.1:123-1160(-)
MSRWATYLTPCIPQSTGSHLRTNFVPRAHTPASDQAEGKMDEAAANSEAKKESKEEPNEESKDRDVAAATPTSPADITTEQLDSALRTIVTPDTYATLTKRKAREQLEVHLGIAPGTFESRKKELGFIIEKIVDEIRQAESEGVSSSDDDEYRWECLLQMMTPTSPADITTEQLDSALRTIVTPDTYATLTKRKAREQLEAHMGISPGTFESRKREVGAIIEKIVEEIRPAESEAGGSSAGGDGGSESGGSSKRKRKQAKTTTAAPKRRGKKEQRDLMSKQEFLDQAEGFRCNIGGNELTIEPREFKTGSVGWGYCGKLPIPIGSTPVTAQVTFNITVVGSKEWV